MKVKWLGHASFLLTSDRGIKVVTDPYTTGGSINYGEIPETADVVTVSHEHGDHNNASAERGTPVVLRGTVTMRVKDIEFTGVSTFHDTAQGAQRGPNTVFCFVIDGIEVCHLGDLGHVLSDQEISDVGEVDLLLIPVGGNYTIDATVATEICNQLNPRVVIPMHYKTEGCDYPIADAEDFLRGRVNVIRRTDDNEVELRKEYLSQTIETIVLKHAL